MKIYLSTFVGGSEDESLTKLNKKERLVSYYHLKQKGVTKEQLERYKKTGKIRKVGKWWIELRDHLGIVRRFAGLPRDQRGPARTPPGFR